MTLLTDDGTPIDAAYAPGAGPADGPAIVVAHGFTGALERPAVRRAAEVLGRNAAVVTFSFRGHGRSGGRSTVGDREVLDLAAAVRWARELGHRRVATVGFSMGGSVVLRHAALFHRRHGAAGGRVEIQPDGARPSAVYRERTTGRTDAQGGAPITTHAPPWGTPVTDSRQVAAVAAAYPGTALGGHPGARAGDAYARAVPGDDASPGVAPGSAVPGGGGAHPDAVVAVSAPARWYYRGTAPMRRLHWVVMRPTGRLVSRYGLRTRIAPEDWDPVPLSPAASVPLIAPTPLLIVHGDRDAYFPLDHPRMLAEAGDPSSTELWIEHGMGHAENSATPDLLGRVARWATAHV